MSKTLTIGLIAGAVAAAAVAVASYAGPNNNPNMPIANGNNLPGYNPNPSNCAAGFSQTASSGGASNHSFTCTANVICPKGMTNFQGIGGTATRTGQMNERLQYSCTYIQNN